MVILARIVSLTVILVLPSINVIYAQLGTSFLLVQQVLARELISVFQIVHQELTKKMIGVFPAQMVVLLAMALKIVLHVIKIMHSGIKIVFLNVLKVSTRKTALVFHAMAVMNVLMQHHAQDVMGVKF